MLSCSAGNSTASVETKNKRCSKCTLFLAKMKDPKDLLVTQRSLYDYC